MLTAVAWLKFALLADALSVASVALYLDADVVVLRSPWTALTPSAGAFAVRYQLEQSPMPCDPLSTRTGAGKRSCDRWKGSTNDHQRGDRGGGGNCGPKPAATGVVPLASRRGRNGTMMWTQTAGAVNTGQLLFSARSAALSVYGARAAVQHDPGGHKMAMEEQENAHRGIAALIRDDGASYCALPASFASACWFKDARGKMLRHAICAHGVATYHLACLDSASKVGFAREVVELRRGCDSR